MLTTAVASADAVVILVALLQAVMPIVQLLREPRHVASFPPCKSDNILLYRLVCCYRDRHATGKGFSTRVTVFRDHHTAYLSFD